ncbi:MAG: hypothetical protein ACKOTE_13710, partial [Opitutaceae bacterium]
MASARAARRSTSLVDCTAETFSATAAATSCSTVIPPFAAIRSAFRETDSGNCTVSRVIANETMTQIARESP